MSSASSTSRPTTEMSRLSVKPDAPATGFVDGAWWPASRDLAAELPALIAELGSKLGRVESVSYNISAWDAAPRKIIEDGATLRLAGYRTQDHDTVDVISDRQRLTLLVVPPETDPQAAQAALVAASEIGNTDDVDALLRGSAQEQTSSS